MTPLTALQVSFEMQIARLKAQLVSTAPLVKETPVLRAHNLPKKLYVASPKAWRDRRLAAHCGGPHEPAHDF